MGEESIDNCHLIDFCRVSSDVLFVSSLFISKVPAYIILYSPHELVDCQCLLNSFFLSFFFFTDRVISAF